MSVPEQDYSSVRKRSVFARIAIGLILLAGVAAAIFYVVVYGTLVGPPKHVVWRSETAKLYGAMESFRERFGEYPPNFDDMDGVAQFVERTFPQYDAAKSTPFPKDLDAAEALVFWLNGISANPADPFAAELDAAKRHVFYEFQPGRLRDGRFYQSSEQDSQPFIYFEQSCYDTAEYNGFRPYVRTHSGRTKEYCAPETCQIIAAGADNRFGHGGLLADIAEADRDNLVSFDVSRTVGDIETGE